MATEDPDDTAAAEESDDVLENPHRNSNLGYCKKGRTPGEAQIIERQSRDRISWLSWSDDRARYEALSAKQDPA